VVLAFDLSEILSVFISRRSLLLHCSSRDRRTLFGPTPSAATKAETARPRFGIMSMCSRYTVPRDYLPIILRCRRRTPTVIRPPIDARAFVSPPLKTAIITGHLMFLLSPMAFYDLNTIYLYIYIHVCYHFFFFVVRCGRVCVSSAARFRIENPSPFVGRRFVRDVAVSALLTTHNARYIIIIIIIIISCHRIPPRLRPSLPLNNMSLGAYFLWFFSDFFLFHYISLRTIDRYGGFPIRKQRG